MWSLIPLESEDNTYQEEEELVWLRTRDLMRYTRRICQQRAFARLDAHQYSPKHDNTVDLAQEYPRFPELGWLVRFQCDVCEATIIMPVDRATINAWGRALMGWTVMEEG
jgi:hypothetical protein